VARLARFERATAWFVVRRTSQRPRGFQALFFGRNWRKAGFLSMVYRFFLAGFMGVKVIKSENCDDGVCGDCEYYVRGDPIHGWKACCTCGWRGSVRKSTAGYTRADVKAHTREDWDKHISYMANHPRRKSTLELDVLNVVTWMERLASLPEWPHDPSTYTRMAQKLRQALKTPPGDDSQEAAKPPVFTIQPYINASIGCTNFVLCCDGVIVPGQTGTLVKSAPTIDWPLEFTVEFEAGPGLLAYVDTPAIERGGG